MKLLGLFRDDSCFRFGKPGRQSVVHFIELQFVLRDCWIGAYWGNGNLYICLVPMLPIVIHLPSKAEKREGVE